VATDVWLTNNDEIPGTTNFLMENVHYAVLTPLAQPIIRQKSLWRIAFAIYPNETRSDDELLSDEQIAYHYEKLWPGSRPLKFEIENRTLHGIHQRLAAIMKRGRCVLVWECGTSDQRK
jgi:hypothetical protein